MASPGYLAANGTPLQLSELAGHACLVHGSLPVWPLQEGLAPSRGLPEQQPAGAAGAGTP